MSILLLEYSSFWSVAVFWIPYGYITEKNTNIFLNFCSKIGYPFFEVLVLTGFFLVFPFCLVPWPQLKQQKKEENDWIFFSRLALLWSNFSLLKLTSSICVRCSVNTLLVLILLWFPTVKVISKVCINCSVLQQTVTKQTNSYFKAICLYFTAKIFYPWDYKLKKQAGI